MKKKHMHLDLNIPQDEAYQQLGTKMTDELVQIAEMRGSIDLRVHEMRRQLKKLRSLLRLVRKQHDKSAYKEANYFFRDVGRFFAEARDARVRVDTLKSLLTQLEEPMDEDAFVGIVNIMVEQHREVKKKLSRKFWEEMSRNAQTSRSRVLSLTPEPKDFKTYKKSVKKIYKDCREAFELAANTRGVEELHEFRKQVKYLRYIMTFLTNIWPKMLIAFEDVSHDLTDFLGEDHDLSDLISWMDENSWPEATVEEKTLLESLAFQKQHILREKAMVLSTKIFLDSPSQFVKRLACYW